MRRTNEPAKKAPAKRGLSRSGRNVLRQSADVDETAPHKVAVGVIDGTIGHTAIRARPGVGLGGRGASRKAQNSKAHGRRAPTGAAAMPMAAAPGDAPMRPTAAAAMARRSMAGVRMRLVREGRICHARGGNADGQRRKRTDDRSLQ